VRHAPCRLAVPERALAQFLVEQLRDLVHLLDVAERYSPAGDTVFCGVAAKDESVACIYQLFDLNFGVKHAQTGSPKAVVVP